MTFRNWFGHFIPNLAIAMLLVVVAYSAKATPDDAQIAHTMLMQFDKPKSPLTVAPIAISGNHAIAGWIQGDRGGRALLHRNDGQWQILLCSGDEMAKPDFLRQAGLPDKDAKSLLFQLQALEAQLDPTHRKQISSFEGVMRVEGNQHGHVQ